jgi:hypothetical protein
MKNTATAESRIGNHNVVIGMTMIDSGSEFGGTSP